MLRRFFLPALALIVTLWLIAACGATTAPEPTGIQTPPTALPPTATPTPEPSPTPMSALAILEAAQETGKNGEPFHMEMYMVMTMTMPAAGLTEPIRVPMTMIGDVQPPDRTHATLSLSMQGVSVDTEMVTISNTTYIKDPTTGKWQVTTESATPVSPEELTSFKAEDIGDLAIVGEEEIDGTPTYHLAGTATMPLELGDPFGTASGTVDIDYWIEKETSRIRRAAILGDIPITGEMTATISMSITLTMSDYGKPVTIEAPDVEAAP